MKKSDHLGHIGGFVTDLVIAARAKGLSSDTFEHTLYNEYNLWLDNRISAQELLDRISSITSSKSRVLWAWARDYYNDLPHSITRKLRWNEAARFDFTFCKVCDNKPIGKCCGDVTYCSTKCQEKDWDNHEKDCKRKINDTF